MTKWWSILPKIHHKVIHRLIWNVECSTNPSLAVEEETLTGVRLHLYPRPETSTQLKTRSNVTYFYYLVLVWFTQWNGFMEYRDVYFLVYTPARQNTSAVFDACIDCHLVDISQHVTTENRSSAGQLHHEQRHGTNEAMLPLEVFKCHADTL